MFKHAIILALLAILPFGNAQALGETDFAGMMMEIVSNKTATYPESDYKFITVGPTMMENALEFILTQNSENQDDSKKPILAKLYKSVKSLRIFTAENKTASYETLAKRLISENQAIYKTFQTKSAVQNNAVHIWTRKAGTKVVEIVMLKEATRKGEKTQIINFTGNFTKEFINLLLKL